MELWTTRNLSFMDVVCVTLGGACGAAVVSGASVAGERIFDVMPVMMVLLWFAHQRKAPDHA